MKAITFIMVIAGLCLSASAEASSTGLMQAKQCDFYEAHSCFMRLDIEYSKTDNCLSIGYRGLPLVVQRLWVHGKSGFLITKELRQKGVYIGRPSLIFDQTNKLCACRKYPGFDYAEDCLGEDVIIPGSYDVQIDFAPIKTRRTLPRDQDYELGGARFDLEPDGTVIHRK